MKLIPRKIEKPPEILDQCLTQILEGTAGIEACLQQFPENAAALRELLEMAERVRSGIAPVGPDTAYISAARARVLNRIRVSGRKVDGVAATRPRPGRMVWRLAYALIAILVAVGLALGSVGVAQASADALPGESLYGVKRAIEETQLAFTWSTAGDAALIEEFAEKRLSEASAVADNGRAGDLALALGGYDDMISRLTALAESSDLEENPGLLSQVQANLEKHIRALQEVRSHAPAAAQTVIDEGIERSRHSYAVIELLKSGGSPSDIAPGRQKTPEGPGGKPNGNRGAKTESAPGQRGTERTPGPPPWARPKPQKSKTP